MKKVYLLIVSLLVSSIVIAAPVSIPAPKIGNVEVAFSPNGGAEELVMKLIRSARSDIQVMAYGFTSRPIIEALVKAQRRGVNVVIAADSSNINNPAGLSALSILNTAGVKVRTVSKFRILHDKVVIVDGKHVEFGSFNFTKSAETANSENVAVFWDAPEMAEVYFKHWEKRWRAGKAFTTNY